MNNNKLIQSMLMIKLNLTSDNGYRTSNEMKAIVSDETGTDESIMRTGISLYSKDHKNAYTRMVSQARRYYLDNTLPWDRNNWRVVPVSKWQEVKSRLDEYISDIKDAFYDVFDKGYEDLKTTFENSCKLTSVKFPDKGDILARFQADYDIGQIASCDDIRIQGIDYAEREKIKSDMKDMYDKKINTGLTELADKLTVAVDAVSCRADDNDQKGKKYTKSLNQLSELADTVQSLNITGNDAISEACKIIKDDISIYSAEAIKTTEAVRDNVVNASANIKEKLAGIKL
tara:strand:- start:6321 stop:7181 length:861 start_codon:yes stop_codon:yes gene_type:complete